MHMLFFLFFFCGARSFDLQGIFGWGEWEEGFYDEIPFDHHLPTEGCGEDHPKVAIANQSTLPRPVLHWFLIFPALVADEACSCSKFVSRFGVSLVLCSKLCRAAAGA